MTSLDDALSEEEIFSIAAMLFLAGRTTMMNMLAGGLFALLANRAQVDVLVGDPDGVDVAVDELLRYVSVLAFGVTRRAVADVELGGTVISAGDHVTAALHGANRDAAKWDAPDGLDLTRRATGHAAFGHGVHICLGQHLARLEMRIAAGASQALSLVAPRRPGHRRSALLRRSARLRPPRAAGDVVT